VSVPSVLGNLSAFSLSPANCLHKKQSAKNLRLCLQCQVTSSWTLEGEREGLPGHISQGLRPSLSSLG
jgi:hypothetical protein